MTVHYSRQASTYQKGRALAAADLAGWRTAAEDVCCPRGAAVVDVGAGTGIFARAWASWGARIVIGCEPSAEMVREGRRVGLPPSASMIRARAEQLPLRQGTADVVWASTVIHHISDLAAWGSECRRVLRPGGTLLIRNLFADLGRVGWAQAFPAMDTALGLFPPVTALTELLASQGLEPLAVAEVPDRPGRPTAGEAAVWIRAMRNFDSILARLSDDQVEEGLRRLNRDPDHRLAPTLLGLIALRAPR